MADVVIDTNAIYALIREYREESDTFELAIEFTNACKPILSELKKVCPWPFGNSYQIPCDNVIKTAVQIIVRALSRIEHIIIDNIHTWGIVRLYYLEDIESSLDLTKLREIEEILNSYFLYNDSKVLLDKVMNNLFIKLTDLFILYVRFNEIYDNLG